MSSRCVLTAQLGPGCSASVAQRSRARLRNEGSVRSVGAHRRAAAREQHAFRICAKGGDKKEEQGPTDDPGPVLKAVWYAAEAFGDIVGLAKGGAKQSSASLDDSKPLSRAESIQLLKEDYSVYYFISGKGEMTAYDPECVFADPFVSFKGVDRFKKNVSNLGGLMLDVNLKVSDFETDKEGNVVTNWKFSCILNLPWKPLLAAAGGTTHVFDPDTGRVVKHIERWDIEPSTVVGQLFRPGPASRRANL